MKSRMLPDEFHLTDRQFQELRQFFFELTGNRLGEEKKGLLEGRLRKSIISMNSVEDYIKAVKNRPQDRNEFISALTTHKTDWFREKVHMDFVQSKIKQQMSHRKDNWMVWSAASSSGEEIYSLLMTFLEAQENRVRILGTDISEKCVRLGSEGLYQAHQVQSQVQGYLVQKYFLRGTVDGQKMYKFNPELQNHCKWRVFNLMSSDLNSFVQFDFIFLRNVLIYFNAEDAFFIISRLLKYLKPGGYIIVGLSENVPNAAQLKLKRVENSVYQKL